jgi:hypothetical protein
LTDSEKIDELVDGEGFHVVHCLPQSAAAYSTGETS